MAPMPLMNPDVDCLNDPRETWKWLASLDREPVRACGEISAALTRATGRVDGYTAERYAAVLLADEHTLPLWAELMAKYASGGDGEHAPAGQIMATLSELNQAFAAYYDALIEALRRTPRRDRAQTYTILVRRLAHARNETLLQVLRRTDALRWERIHRLYAFAQQQVPTYTPAPEDGTAGPALVSSAESEYIQILLLHQLHQGRLEALDIVRAAGWLARWVIGLAITKSPVSGHAFALYPNGRAGLIEPPKSIKSGLLWLDVGPLHTQIRQAIHEEHERPLREGGSFPSTFEQRITVLDRLLELWQGPAPESVRRELRRPLRKPVLVSFDFPSIVPAMRQGEMSDESLTQTGRPATFEDLGPDTVRDGWMVSDVSDSGCRLQGRADLDVRIGPGTLVVMRSMGSGARIIGIVRRLMRPKGDDVDLGVQLLATSLRLLELRDETPAATEGGRAAAADGPGAARSSATPDRPALFLGPGAGRFSRIRESMIVRPADYALGRVYACQTARNNYRLALGQAVESTSDYVWAVVSVTKLSPRLPQ